MKGYDWLLLITLNKIPVGLLLFFVVNKEITCPLAT